MVGDFGQVYEEQVTPVWRYVRARVPDPDAAQDLTAEVFARALRDRARFDPDRGSVGAWLCGIARHAVADWWRGRGTEVSVGEVDPARSLVSRLDADPEPAALRTEAVDEVRRHLAGLRDRERDALALRFGAGLRAAEVGAAMGISEAAAKMLVHRAVTKLRAVMDHG